MTATTVAITEVGPRDGLQNQPAQLPARTRAALIDQLSDTGLRSIEAVSFVNPERVPQMAGAEEVVSTIRRRKDVCYAGLVLNERGYGRFRATGLGEARYVFAASATFNRKNANASVPDALRTAERILKQAQEDGVRHSVTIGTAFGCPFEGVIPSAHILKLCEALLTAGWSEIILADTIGVAVPRQVSALVEGATELGARVGVHLHNTRNTGFANVMAAIGSGATQIDSSVGGVGGCPFAPRATGNIATEDLIYLLDGEGVETGVDLEAVIAVANWLERQLGRELEGQVYKAGPFNASPSVLA